MKRATIISLALILGLCLVAGAFAADKDAIKKQVDEIVVSIDSGKKAQDKISPAMYL
jgi:low affinity Fe/Cu permease